MSDLASELLEFIVRVFGHWQAWVTGGGVMAVLTVWERLSGKPLSRRTYVNLVIIGFLLVAGFLAWRDEYKINIAHQQESDNPAAKLIAEADESFGYNWKQGGWVIMILLNITNIGKNPSIAQKFELNVTCPDKNDLGLRSFTTPPKSELRMWDLGDHVMRILADELIENRMVNQPINSGSLVRGWLIFDVEINTPLNCKYLLNFRDTFGRIYFLSLPSIEKIPPAPKRFINYPGITGPFVPKSALKKEKD